MFTAIVLTSPWWSHAAIAAGAIAAHACIELLTR